MARKFPKQLTLISPSSRSIIIEACLFYGEDVEIAFDDCRTDFRAAEKEARCYLRSLLDRKSLHGIKTEVLDFIEFDSSNWTHAGAYFNVKVTGSSVDIAAIEDAQAKE